MKDSTSSAECAVCNDSGIVDLGPRDGVYYADYCACDVGKESRAQDRAYDCGEDTCASDPQCEFHAGEGILEGEELE